VLRLKWHCQVEENSVDRAPRCCRSVRPGTRYHGDEFRVRARNLTMPGGALIVETSARKEGRVREYICARRRKNGSCANALRIAIEEMHEAVLQAIEEHALTPEAIESVIRLSERDDLAERRVALDREHKDVTKRIARIVSAIENGGEATSL